jgi:hypothetical protein
VSCHNLSQQTSNRLAQEAKEREEQERLAWEAEQARQRAAAEAQERAEREAEEHARQKKLRDEAADFQKWKVFSKKGIKMKKHGRQGWPHERLITVDLDDAEVAKISWENGFIDLGYVSDVTPGKETKVFARSDVTPELCFSVHAQDRTLDLECDNTDMRYVRPGKHTHTIQTHTHTIQTHTHTHTYMYPTTPYLLFCFPSFFQSCVCMSVCMCVIGWSHCRHKQTIDGRSLQYHTIITQGLVGAQLTEVVGGPQEKVDRRSHLCTQSEPNTGRSSSCFSPPAPFPFLRRLLSKSLSIY